MTYDLPKSLKICGSVFRIRWDYRAILDAFRAINAQELREDERMTAALQIFYPDFDELPDLNEASMEMFKFMNGGELDKDSRKHAKLMDWEQDFHLIVAPVNRVLGMEVRSAPSPDDTPRADGLHWWTFLSAYMEIGDCLFAQVVSIRSKKAKGKRLDKLEQEFYRKNKDLIELKSKYTSGDEKLVRAWAGGEGNGCI